MTSIVIAAIAGLGYLGLAVQKQLSVLTGGIGTETTDQKIKNAWDVFFEGLLEILDDEDEIENLLKEGKKLKSLLLEKSA